MSRVVILGAGASAGYENGNRGIRPPVARTFFRAVGMLLNGNNGLVQEQYSKLWEFLEKFYGILVGGLANCDLDIEEVLTLIDIGKAGARVRRQLLDLIVLTLDKVIYGIPCPHHQRLLRLLHADDTIITFNWDLLVDNICQDGPNYGTNLLEMIYETEGSRHTVRNGPVVLKPHGSMNWMTCRKCRKTFAHILGGKTAAIYHAGGSVQCRSCLGVTEPLIIPPTLMKNYKHPVIEAIWDVAAKVLYRASEIVIIGYSLPVTDFKAKWLLLKASAERQNPLESVRIYDISPEPLIDRFAHVFRISDQVFHVVQGGIREASQYLEQQ